MQSARAEVLEPVHRLLGDDLAAAEKASANKDFIGALNILTELRQRHPNNPIPYYRSANLLRRLEQYGQADSLLAEGQTRFPNQPAMYLDYPRSAEERGDWPEALRRWELVREKVPDHWLGYTGLARALRELRRYDEADTLLAEGQLRLPQEPAVYVEHCRIAEARGDWPEALRRWDSLRERLPQHRMGYLGAATALRELKRYAEADAILTTGQAHLPHEPAMFIEYARIAELRRDWSETLRRWNLVRSHYPNNCQGYSRAAAALRELKLYDEADALLGEGQARFPSHAEMFVDYPRIAEGRHDWLEALRRWELVREKAPNHWWCYIGMAAALRELKRHDEADTLLAGGQAHFPDQSEIFFEYARTAEMRGDWPEALRRWERVRQEWPNNRLGYIKPASILRDLKRYDEADALLVEGQAHLPDDPGISVDYARIAEMRRDWPETLRRWEQFRAKMPDHRHGYSGAATALRELKRFEEADALLTEGQQLFADDPMMYVDYSRVAEAQKNWPEALRRWRLVQEKVPGNRLSLLGAAAVLQKLRQYDEADVLLTEGYERFSDDLSVCLDYARSAHSRHDWAEAARRWALLRDRFPQCAEGYLGGQKALASLGRINEADDLLTKAQIRLPDDPQVALELARKSLRNHEWEQAQSQFATARKLSPHQAAAYLGGVEALIIQGQWEKADLLLQEGMAVLPADPEIALKYAQLPSITTLHDKRDQPETIRRLTEILGRFPDSELVHAAAIRILREADQLAAAEKLALDSLERMPNSSSLAVEHGNILIALGDLEAAAEYLTSAKGRSPNTLTILTLLADVLSRLSRFDEAEEILESAISDFTTEAVLFDLYARIALRRDDLKTALSRLTEAQRRFPNEGYLQRHLSNVKLLQVGLEDDGETPRVSVPNDEAPHCANQSLCDIMCSFESLGGRGQGCEFGLVQRELGAEPIGLLRWADMSIEDITAAMEGEFEGVGLPEHTELVIPKGRSKPEYLTRDRRFGMQMHTYITIADSSADRVFNQACRRLQYLTRKLLEDLKLGSKIFVYKNTARNLKDIELNRIHSAMRRFGNNTLLYVAYSDAEHPNGMVEIMKPGLMVGYIDRFAVDKDEQKLGPNTISWRKLCLNAYHLWKASN